VRRALTTAVVVVVAVVLQVTLVNRLPLPYGAVPSIVLILVAAAAVTDGPLAGAITGFAAGLTLDIAPPGSHLVGEYALVYCLVGYACGHAVQLRDAGTLPVVLIAAAGAAAGEAASAMLGLMFSDPEVTWAAIKDVLPAAVIYDVLLTPFAYGLLTRLRPVTETDWGRASRRAFGGAAPAFGAAGQTGNAFRGAGAGLSAAAFSGGGALAGLGGTGGRGGTGVRLAGGGNTPRLKLTGLTSPAFRPPAPRREAKLKLAGLTTPAFRPPAPRREAKLKLAGLTSPALTPKMPRRETKLNLARSGPSHTRPASSRPVRMSFGTRRGGAIGGTSRRPVLTRENARTPRFHQGRGPLALLAHLLRPRQHAATPGRGWLKVKPPPKRRAPKSPSRKWLSSKPSGGMRKRRYVQKNWVRSSRRRRARSRLGGWR
jgi:rod shape-determining protein MreD